jgi:hypothetical protein
VAVVVKVEQPMAVLVAAARAELLPALQHSLLEIVIQL